MRTRFHYELEGRIACDQCKELVPLGPLRSFLRSRSLLVTRCPSCGAETTTSLNDADRVLDSRTDVRTLVRLGREPEAIEPFDWDHRQAKPPCHTAARGRVGGPERCVHCGDPIAIPTRISPDSAATVGCGRCAGVTHLWPPPRWLKTICPPLTHLMLPTAPATVSCPSCSAKTAVGPTVPSEICCHACGAEIAIPERPASFEGLDHPRMVGRVELTSAVVEAELSAASVLFILVLFCLVMAAGLIYLVVDAARTVGTSRAILMGLLATVPTLLGILFLVFGLRSRTRRRAILAELKALEVRPECSDGEGPYR